MNHLLDDDDDVPRRRGERELTLSTGAILGIFFGLALICGFFFAFGYNMGHKAAPAYAATSSDNSDSYASATAAYSSSKPAAGSPLGQPTATKTPEANADFPGTSSNTAGAKSAQAVGAPPAPATRSANPQEEVRTPAAPAFAAPMPHVSSTGNFVVQVAAVSHQEDADLLVNALQRKGYTVAARNQAGDKLVHIQVGPFSDRKDADAMKQRLQGDGYNAMIKQL